MRYFLAGILLCGLVTAVAAEPIPVHVLHFGRTGQLPGAMNAPFGICGDGEGHVYFTELFGNRIQKWSEQGVYESRWGTQGTEPGFLYHPADVAMDDQQHLWIADRGNHRLQCFDRDGTWLGAFGSQGSKLGQFISPAGLVSRGGFVYVADTYNNRVQKLAIRGGTLEPVTAFGDSGSAPGQLSGPEDVDLTPSGLLVVTDSNNNRVQVLSSDGTPLLRFGGTDGASSRRLSFPYGVAVDVHGNFYVSEPYRRQVQKFDSHGEWVLQWGATAPTKRDRFERPLHMWIDAAGLLWVCDYDDTGRTDRIVVWRPADAPTPVQPVRWGDVRAAYR